MSKKRLIFMTAALCSFAICSGRTAFAASNAQPTQIMIEEAENGNYYETIIETLDQEQPPYSVLATTQYITKTKTTYYKNSSGTVLWSVSITATFSYDGSTSKCTSCSHSTTAPSPNWSISSSSSSRSGNSATATATAVYKLNSTTSSSHTKSVTIQCSPTGVVS